MAQEQAVPVIARGRRGEGACTRLLIPSETAQAVRVWRGLGAMG